MTANPKFETWAKSYSGCDGGDIGSPERRAIWLCGIEWGGARTAEQLKDEMQCDEPCPPRGYGDASENLTYIFNRQVMKIIAAIHGHPLSEYRDFCQQAKPFTQGSSGYFKMNLYPIAFKDTNQARWYSNFAEATGLENKSDYLDWCRKHRFPHMRQWAARARPKLILCLGKSYRDDFQMAFHDKNSTFTHDPPIDGHDLWWCVNAEGTLVAVIPFMVNRYGLTRNESIQKFGDRIAKLMEQHGCRQAQMPELNTSAIL